MATTSTLVKAEKTTAAQSTELPTDSPTNELESKAIIETADKYLSAATALVVMNPLEKKNSYAIYGSSVPREPNL